MTINYIDPLSRAWKRMTKALFKPFDIGKWFVVGFTAFLAGLTDCHNGGGSSNGHGKGRLDFSDIFDFPIIAREWLTDNQGWFALIIIGVLVVIALVILLTWLSSRGKFMFLDNVVHDRAKVTKPWHEFRMQGNSLFLWRLCFGFICLAVFALFLFQCFIIATDIYDDNLSTQNIVLLIVGMALLALAVIVVTAYISLFLTDFVVPIMYKNNISATRAWSHFLPLFKRHWLHFILYGLLVLVLTIAVVILVIFAGIFTCCLGFLLLIIPYIGSVTTLPISYTYRAFSLKFLEQFGPEFILFPQSENLPDSSPTQ